MTPNDLPLARRCTTIYITLCTVTISSYNGIAPACPLCVAEAREGHIESAQTVFRSRRSGAQRHYREILRVADSASCSEGGEGRPCAPTRERCQGYPNPSLRPGDVVASPLQHLPIAVFGDVYLRDIWDVFLHACQRQERTGRRLQFQDVRAVDDTAVPGDTLL